MFLHVSSFSVFKPIWSIKVHYILHVGWLVVLGFNATVTAKVISWRLVTHTCFLAFSHQSLLIFSFQGHRLLFSHAPAEVRGENTPKRKFSSTGDRTHNHQVIHVSLTRSPLSHPAGAFITCMFDLHFTSLYFCLYLSQSSMLYYLT